MEPLLSIIIPAYNMEQYLDECLSSVEEQDNGNIEVIVVDDGSVDRTVELARTHAATHPFLTVLTQANAGPSKARNYGIASAKGKYVCFLDSDDSFPTDSIRRLCDALASSEPDVAIGRYENYYEATGEIGDCGYRLDEKQVGSLQGEALFQYLTTGRIYEWYSWLLTVRREFLQEEHLLFPTDITVCEDVRWSSQVLAKAQRVIYVDAPLYRYRRNRQGSITATFSPKNFEERLSALCFFETFCNKMGYSQTTMRSLQGSMVNLYVSALFDARSFEKSQCKAYLNQLRRYRFLLAESPRRYHRLLNLFWGIFGIGVTSRLLYARANWVRKKMIR